MRGTSVFLRKIFLVFKNLQDQCDKLEAMGINLQFGWFISWARAVTEIEGEKKEI